MTDLYTQSLYFENKKKAKVILIVSVIIFALIIALVLLSGLFMNYRNATMFKAIDSVILSIAFIAFLFVMMEIYYPLNQRNNLVYRLLTVNRYVGEVEILSISTPMIVSKGIRANEIKCLNDEGKTTVVYLENSLPLSIKEGQKIRVILAQNFIVGVEDVNHD